ncbi:MAG: hypothetical protein ABIH21_03630 [Patescibacteria group bacterium]
MKWLRRYRKPLAIVGGILACFFLFWMMFCHYTPVGTAHIQFNRTDGSTKLDSPGLHFTPPWVQAAKIELRPMRMCITTAGKGYNCKLVQFVPEHFKEFVEVEGFRYYWFVNRISFNWGHDETYRGFEDIIRGHTFGAKKYAFLKELQSYDEP